MTADEAALLFRDGMMVATSGSTMGFPKATFRSSVRSGSRREGGLKIDLLCAGPLSSEVEDVLAEAGGIRTTDRRRSGARSSGRRSIAARCGSSRARGRRCRCR